MRIIGDPLSWFSAIMTGLLRHNNNNRDEEAVQRMLWDDATRTKNEPDAAAQRPRNEGAAAAAADVSLIQSNMMQGTLWQGADAAKTAVVSTADTGKERRLCFRNRTDETVILCWVDETGGLHHFYALHPWRGRGSRGLLLVRNNGNGNGSSSKKVIGITDEDHVETTVEGHAFLIAAAADVDAVRTSESLEGEGVRILGAYRAEKQPEDAAAAATRDPDQDATPMVHLIEVVDPAKVGATCSFQSLSNWFACCRPKRNLKNDDDDDIVELLDHDRYVLTARLVALLDDAPLDTTKKHYETATLGRQCHWPVMLENNWYGDDPDLEQVLECDLDHMASCLPAHAVTLLRDTQPTPIWINRTLKYGPKDCPVTAGGMCFHPGTDWLIQQGMHPAKCECVELYSSACYRTSRQHWGTGGLLLHEFSHAYHHKACANGYENAEILACYEAAMKEGLYESVRVHGSQGPTTKAYACTDAMEYFAELSTAFLGGIASKQKERGGVGDDEDGEEFNKWYPFNRNQIREHDPRAYELLKKIWKVEDDE